MCLKINKYKSILIRKNKLNGNLNKWKTFIQIFFDPLVFILCILLLFAIHSYYNNSCNPDIRTFLTIGISIISSVWAGVFSNKWLKIFEEQAINARGKTAIKNLSLLISSIENVEIRLEKFQRCCEPEVINKDLLKSNFQEVGENLKTLKNIGYNSIETWKDIIPEADLTKTAEKINELQHQFSKLTIEKKELENKQLQQTDEINESNNLKEKIKYYEEKINEISSDLHNCKMKSPGGALYNYIENTLILTCPYCFQEFSEEDLESNNCKCPECGCRIK